MAETGRGIIYGRFFLLFFFVSSRKDKMRAWLGTATAGQKGQTRGPASAREADVRQEAKDAASCFFTDLWRLNGDRPRGAPSKEYLERVRARELLVASYVSSYDVSSNPTVEEGENIQSVKKFISLLISLQSGSVRAKQKLLEIRSTTSASEGEAITVPH